MKITYSLLFLLISLPISLCAQQNVLRIYPLQTAFNKNIRLSYERVLTDKFSLSADLGYSWPHTFMQIVVGRFNDSTGFVEFMENNAKVSGINAGLQFRFYPSGKAPAGFFIAPYVRHLRSSGNFENLAITEDITGSLELGLNRTAGGVMFGYQFLIDDRVSIDWQILGIGYTQYTARLVAQANLGETGDFGKFVTDANNYIQQYNDIPLLPNVPVNIDWENNRYEVRPSIGSVSFRSAIGVGIAF